MQVDARGSVRTDGFGQTNVEGIYAAGDARQVRAGSVSMAHARIAALHATGQETEPYDETCMVIPFLSNPQVAQVGVLSAAHDAVRSVEVPMQSALKTHISGHTQGFLRLAWNRRQAGCRRTGCGLSGRRRACSRLRGRQDKDDDRFARLPVRPASFNQRASVHGRTRGLPPSSLTAAVQ